MKCTNCGKNNASYHYRYNLNGKVTEAHLCPECAATVGAEAEADMTKAMNDAFSEFDNMFDGFFGGFFGRRGMNPFSSFGLPGLVMPRLAFAAPAEKAGSAEASPEAKPAAVDAELSKRREINALREEMRAAAEAEDYEKAAEIRDRLRELEK